MLWGDSSRGFAVAGFDSPRMTAPNQEPTMQAIIPVKHSGIIDESGTSRLPFETFEASSRFIAHYAMRGVNILELEDFKHHVNNVWNTSTLRQMAYNKTGVPALLQASVEDARAALLALNGETPWKTMPSATSAEPPKEAATSAPSESEDTSPKPPAPSKPAGTMRRRKKSS